MDSDFMAVCEGLFGKTMKMGTTIKSSKKSRKKNYLGINKKLRKILMSKEGSVTLEEARKEVEKKWPRRYY